MKDSNTKKIKDLIGLTIIVLIVYTIFHFFGIGCPIKFFTGISCAGCGMSRAWICILHLDFIGAFGFHPLFWLVPPGAIVLIFSNHIPKKIYKSIIWSILILFLVVYIIRLMDTSDNIVVVDIENGAILRFFKRIFKL